MRAVRGCREELLTTLPAEEDEDDDDEDSSSDEEEDEDDDGDDEVLDGLDLNDIIAPTSRRSARSKNIDYSSEEAMKKAGLDQGAGASAEDDEEDEFKVRDFESAPHPYALPRLADVGQLGDRLKRRWRSSVLSWLQRPSIARPRIRTSTTHITQRRSSTKGTCHLIYQRNSDKMVHLCPFASVSGSKSRTMASVETRDEAIERLEELLLLIRAGIGAESRRSCGRWN